MTLSYCVTTVIFHGLIRESQTIDSGSSHYSTLFKEHTPQHKTKIPLPAAVTPRKAKRPRMACFVLYWFGRPHIPPGMQRTPARPRTVSQPPNRTVLFNIASILCLSMLFSKNSEVYPRKPLRRTLPQRLTTPSRSVRASQ